ncbi:MAG: sulfotransferase family protein [Candidatus Eiseniibacteriota bacterium]
MSRSGPVFVVGAPRSGTTLLLETLNRHPDLWLCEETYFLHFVWGRRQRLGDLRNERNRRRLVDAYLATKRVRQQDVDLAKLAEALMEEGTSYEAFFESLMRFCARAHGRTRFGEKTPDHARRADVLCNLFPDCALVHLVRDPRDVVASLLRMPWGDKSVLANTRQWVECERGALAVQGRPNYFRVVFEDLVANPEVELGKLCDFVGVPFSAAMLEAGDEKDANRWWLGRARTAIDASRAMRWKRELSPSQAALVEWLARDTMKELGYVPCCGTATPTLLARARVAEALDRARWSVKRLPGTWYYRVRPLQLAAEEATMDALA